MWAGVSVHLSAVALLAQRVLHLRPFDVRPGRPRPSTTVTDRPVRYRLPRKQENAFIWSFLRAFLFDLTAPPPLMLASSVLLYLYIIQYKVILSRGAGKEHESHLNDNIFECTAADLISFRFLFSLPFCLPAFLHSFLHVPFPFPLLYEVLPERKVVLFMYFDSHCSRIASHRIASHHIAIRVQRAAEQNLLHSTCVHRRVTRRGRVGSPQHVFRFLGCVLTK